MQLNYQNDKNEKEKRKISWNETNIDMETIARSLKLKAYTLRYYISILI